MQMTEENTKKIKKNCLVTEGVGMARLHRICRIAASYKVLGRPFLN